MNSKLILLSSVALCFVLSPIFAMDFSSTTTQSAYSDKAVSDTAVTQAVKNAFAMDKDLSPFVNKVSVTTENGVVTLSGTVGMDSTKSAFETKAKAVAGVSKVVNNITVKADTANMQ